MAELIGRFGELEVLNKAAAAALDSSGPVFTLIVGDPGVGKSRLLIEFSKRTDGYSTFYVKGYEVEQQVPLAAAAELIRGFPKLTDLAFRDSGGGLEAIRVFESAYRAVRQSMPMLLCLDDIQWIDETSLALCSYLARAAEADGEPLFLLGATRASGKSEGFRDSMARALPGRTSELRLEHLDHDEGSRLAALWLRDASPEQAARISEIAEGSPFWIEILASSANPEQEAPNAAAERFRRLDSDAIALTAALSVAERPMSMDQIVRLQVWPLDRVRSAIIGASNSGIVVEENGLYRIAHHLLREHAVASVPAILIKRLHKRLADFFLEEAETDMSLLQLAGEHVARAGELNPQLLLRIATSPGRRLLGKEALDSLSKAANQLGFGSSESLELHEAVASLFLELGYHQNAYDQFNAIRLQAPRWRESTALQAATAAYRLGDANRARDALATVQFEDPISNITRESLEASIELWLENQGEQALERSLRALDAARAEVTARGGVESIEKQLRLAYLDTLHICFDSLVLTQKDALAEDHCNEMLDASRGEDQAHLDALITLGNHLRRRGKIFEAEEVLRGAWTKARNEAFAEVALQAGYRLASALLLMGRIDEAEEIAGEADALAERIGGLSATTAWFWADWFGTDVHRGKWRKGIDATLEASAQISNPHFRSGGLIHAATWLSRLEGKEARNEVRRLFETASADIAESRCRRCASELTVTGAEMLARVGYLSEAEELLQNWRADEGDPPLRLSLIFDRTSALLAHLRGEANGLDALEGIARRAGDLGFVIERIWSLLDLAHSSAEADPERAESFYREVIDLTEETGVITERMIAEQGLRSLGVRVRRRGRAEAGGLTKREIEVARLVASGRTNPEIAGDLFLSRKTVERHVSNIFTKLGLRNRSELAAHFARILQT